jgi:hypothetical protein
MAVTGFAECVALSPIEKETDPEILLLKTEG